MAERWDWKEALPVAMRRWRNVHLFVGGLVFGVVCPWTGAWASLGLGFLAWAAGVVADCRDRLFVYDVLGAHPQFIKVAELGRQVEDRVLLLARTVPGDSLLRLKRKVKDFTARAERLAWTLQDVGDGGDAERLGTEIEELRRRARESDDASTRQQYERAAAMKAKAAERAGEATRHYRRAVAELTQIAASLEVVYAKLGTLGAASHRSRDEVRRLGRDLEEAVTEVEDLEEAFRAQDRPDPLAAIPFGNAPSSTLYGAPPVAALAPTPVGELDRDELFALVVRAAVADGRLSKRERRILGELGAALGLEKNRMKVIAHQASRGARARSGATEGELSPAAVFEEALRRVYGDGKVSEEERRLVVAVARVLGLNRRDCEEIQRRVRGEGATA